MPFDIELKFEELRLILDPHKPDDAVGYFDGTAEIHVEGSGYAVQTIWLANTGAGKGLVELANDHPLWPRFALSIERQFDASIRDRIADHREFAW